MWGCTHLVPAEPSTLESVYSETQKSCFEFEIENVRTRIASNILDVVTCTKGFVRSVTFVGCHARLILNNKEHIPQHLDTKATGESLEEK